ncbi:MAG: hypothetical protein HY897_23850 [Deltaproteobacteria bacterium]|nr:hypothetical protein [Deltaproteobacteria bacterium]
MAVTLWIHDLQQRPWAEVEKEMETIREFGKELAEHGDDLLYRSKKPGRTADLFNQTAKAVALLSFLPGGVILFGTHWESHHKD